MRNTIRLAAVFCAVLLIVTGITLRLRHISTANAHKDDLLVVHEWGTFTSIAGKDGVALEWRPLNGATDLPKFVHTMQSAPSGLRHPQSQADLAGTGCLENPGIYFFPNRPMGGTTRVSFSTSKRPLWYPHAPD